MRQDVTEEAAKRSGTAGRKPPASARPAHVGKGDVGNALRSAYQQTVSEAIPPEMLDLLSKLD
jgi:hypothetical protein